METAAGGLTEIVGGGISRGKQMNAEDQYLKFVPWNEVDGLYIGFCPDLFPRGG
ncbi:MAG TPA: hypothetical protein VGO59_10275 [Verrucomicrobiae bacterium]|jgi:hypothetical protein